MHYPEYDKIERYPAEQTIAFTKPSAEWGIFSNFAKTPMVSTNGMQTILMKCNIRILITLAMN